MGEDGEIELDLRIIFKNDVCFLALCLRLPESPGLSEGNVSFTIVRKECKRCHTVAALEALLSL